MRFMTKLRQFREYLIDNPTALQGLSVLELEEMEAIIRAAAMEKRVQADENYNQDTQ